MSDPILTLVDEATKEILDVGEYIIPHRAFPEFRKLILDKMGNRGLKKKITERTGMENKHTSGGNFVRKEVDGDCPKFS